MDCVTKEDSIWRGKNFEHYIMNQFPEVKELSSSRLRKMIQKLAEIKFVAPQTVIAREYDVSEYITLVVEGKIDCFRKIKEAKDQPLGPSVKLSLEPRQGMKELSNVFGDLILSKDVSR